MSFDTKKPEGLVLEEELTAIPYHKLKEEFAARGIGEVWTQGRKKVDMIAEAIEKLGAIKEAVKEVDADESISEEDKAEAVEEIVAKKEEAKVKAEEAKVQEALNKYEAHKQHWIKLLKGRHLKDGRLDIEAVKKSREVKASKKGNRRFNLEALKAHDELLKEYSEACTPLIK